jgi:class 3 adenylate cyclase
VATATRGGDLTSYLPRYQLELLRHRLEQPRADEPRDESVDAALLFVDVSGFTRLTEDFARRGREGAEALSEALNRFFGQLCEIVVAEGGDIVTVAGDSALVLWPVEDGDGAAAVMSATRCALDLQRALGSFAPMPGVSLPMRAGVAFGPVRYLALGGVHGRWESLVVGRALDDVTAAMALATPGEVLASRSAAERLRGRAELTPTEQGLFRAVSTHALASVERAAPRSVDPALAGAIESQLPRLVVDRVRAGQVDWLAEFRTVTVLFVNLVGLDAATAPVAKLHAAMRTMQQALVDHDGAVYQSVADDKGTTFIGAFGIPPHAHADDAARAVRAATEIRRALDAQELATAIGVTTGRVFSGDFGSRQRRHFALRGSAVNLAARLMTLRMGDVLCDATTARAAARQLSFEPLPAVAVKGRDEPVAVARPRGPAQHDLGARARITGRLDERSRIAARIEAAAGGPSAVVIVSGDAGIGKSQLLDDALGQADGKGALPVSAAAESIERFTPYFVFRSVIAQLLGADHATPAALAATLEGLFGDDRKLLAWLPLLNEILPLGLPDTEVTQQMDAASRADATEELVVRLIDAKAASRPVVVAIDDAQWLDSSSIALLRAISRRCARLVLVLAKRPSDEQRAAELSALVDAADERLELGALANDEITSIVCSRLGVDALPPEVALFVLTRAEGHPFYAEELGLALRDAGLIRCEGRVCRVSGPDVNLGGAEFPQSLEGVITGRIDRLTPRQQLALKTASVIGRVFAVEVLSEVYPVREEQTEIPGVLENLERLGVARLFSLEPELAYAFKHVTTHEVAYNLLLLSQRRLLHRQIAEWYERVHAADLSPYFPLIAHHWERAEEPARAIVWLERAAERALRSYANREVVELLARADALARQAHLSIDDAVRARWSRLLGEAHLKLAELGPAKEHLAAALALSGKPLPATKRALSIDLLRQLATQAAHRLAPTRAMRTDDPDGDRFASSIHHSLAEVAFFGHDMGGLLHATFASLNLGERASSTRETVNGLGTLAHVASMAGLRGLARSYRARSLALAEREGALPTVAFAHQIAATYGNCIGDWANVDTSLARAIELFGQLGDRFRWETCQCILGYKHFAVGDYDLALDAWRAARASAGHDGAAQIRAWSLVGELLVQSARLASAEAIGPLIADVERLGTLDLASAERVLAGGALAAAHLFRGENGRAREHAARVMALVEKEPPSTSYTLWSVASTGHVWLSLGGSSKGEALAAAKKIEKLLGTFAFTMPVGAAHAALLAARIADVEGRRRAATALAKKAMTRADALAQPWEGARARSLLAAQLPARSEERRRLLAEARASFAKLGAHREISRIDAES